MLRKRARYTGRERRRQIIGVAMELFARQGFEGTTTRQIARAARVNEAIIFRHFPRKEDLYWAIIDYKCQAAKGRDELRRKLEIGEDERQKFAALAEDILRRNSEDRQLSRLLLFSALKNHRLSHRFFRSYVAEFYETLADYIRKRIREGRFHPVDPVLAARGFVGMVVYHFLIQELFGGSRNKKFVPQRVSAEFADIWLDGMRARNTAGHQSAKPLKRK